MDTFIVTVLVAVLCNLAEGRCCLGYVDCRLVQYLCSYMHRRLSVSTGQQTADHDNCETLGDSRLQVAWTVRREAQMIDFLLCGCAQDETQYATLG